MIQRYMHHYVSYDELNFDFWVRRHSDAPSTYINASAPIRVRCFNSRKRSPNAGEDQMQEGMHLLRELASRDGIT